MNLKLRNIIIRISWRFLIPSLVGSFFVISLFGHQIEGFNASIRNYLVQGQLEKFRFKDGIPTQTNARKGTYQSPFYVVHFGMIYSDSCEKAQDKSKYHWLSDETRDAWRGDPPAATTNNFRSALNWLTGNVTVLPDGSAHFIYDFDWPYQTYPNGKLSSGWWSGLTDGYAILLLLRGYDCFEDKRYLDLASALYQTLKKPVSDGGSTVMWAGKPWIEEYVEPKASDPAALSRVLNGMAYSYFGVRAYEELHGDDKFSRELRSSISHHLDTFDLGVWSFYDALGNRANIKYHKVNTRLLQDERLSGVASLSLLARWQIGVWFSGVYLFLGPISWALLHMWLTFFLLSVVIFLSLGGIKVSSAYKK